ncbi:O-antigen ligase family protein [Mobilicoccus caccae]|uniref:O-antigen ligase-related domain-containing protein n=1 Tax=Mobilicoccus caccae TaxID=1859295 RepID=A0ABQ6IRQ5_9MICO|nr:O-antigen ligase family protein [Mobilicoccus caccae]GMA39958.1 hypothetical protein GCM10025883_20030 [Mobilicoccus caccae]
MAAGDLTLFPLIQLRAATLVILVVAAVALWSARHTPWRRPAPLSLLCFAVLVAVWAPVALLRAPDPGDGRAEVQGLVAGVAVALTVVALSRRSESGLRGMRVGWALGLGLSILVAGYELLTDDHLWIEPGLSWADSHRTIVAGAFRNPNDFAIALTAMISGTLAWAASTRHGRRMRALLVVAVVLGAIAVMLTESRSGLLTLVVVLGLHLWGFLRSRGRSRGSGPDAPVRRRPSRIVLAVGAAVAVALAVAAFVVPALAAHNPVARMLATADQPGTARSDQLRLDLIRAALRYFRDSDGLGTGAASYEVLLAADPAPGVAVHTWLHNSFVELLLQYGVVVAAGLGVVLVVALLAVLRGSVRSRSAGRAGTLSRTETLAALVAFVAMGFASATVLTTPVWWLMLGQAVASVWWAASPEEAQPPAAGVDATPDRRVSTSR